MVGRARLVSASPFRASIKLERNEQLLNNASDSDDD